MSLNIGTNVSSTELSVLCCWFTSVFNVSYSVLTPQNVNYSGQKELFSQTQAIWHSFSSWCDPQSWFILQFCDVISFFPVDPVQLGLFLPPCVCFVIVMRTGWGRIWSLEWQHWSCAEKWVCIAVMVFVKAQQPVQLMHTRAKLCTKSLVQTWMNRK